MQGTSFPTGMRNICSDKMYIIFLCTRFSAGLMELYQSDSVLVNIANWKPAQGVYSF